MRRRIFGKEATVFLSTRYLDILIELVETRLSELLVYGCENPEELAIFKQCRREHRAERERRTRRCAA
ncbi:MAG: hypothetical protein ACE5PT_15275 [Gemmatimonadales bacterium]